jgi:hypothetical protein
VNNTGNPQVNISDLYPYPSIPVPLVYRYGFEGVWVGGMLGTAQISTVL